MEREETNREFDRRSALLLGIGGAATLFGTCSFAFADDVKAKEIAPGVTLKVFKEVDPIAPVPGFKKARLMEITWQPGAILPPSKSTAVAICEIQGAPLYVEYEGKEPFTLQPGDIYFCPVGRAETDTNKSDKPSVMRVIELDAA